MAKISVRPVKQIDVLTRWVTTNIKPVRIINTTEILAAEAGGHRVGDGPQLPGGRRVRQDLQGAVRRRAAGKEAAGCHQGAAGRRTNQEGKE